jgi:mannose PTS system EIIA component
MSGRIGVLLVTHGDAGRDMLDAVTTLAGTDATAGMEAVSVAPGESRDAIVARIDRAVTALDGGAGVLVLTDLFGATPTNCCVELKRAGRRVEVLCGLSLPMLVKIASTDREATDLAGLAHLAAETAIRSIRLGEGGEA